MTLREIIKARAEQRHFGVRDLARQADMNPSQISQYFNGKADLRGESIDRLCEVLRLELKPAGRSSKLKR